MTEPLTPVPETSRRCPICGILSSAEFCPTDRVSTLIFDGQALGVGSLQAGSILGGRYAIERLIGKGGFGSVFQARHTGTGQDVAIKTLGAGLESDDLALRRFFQEARVTAGLRHPNTIRVFDFGQEKDSGMLFLAMELLTGVTLKLELKNRVRQGAVFTEREAIDVGDAVCRSLAEAHGAGLVHRDLKPDNIFLHRIDGDDLIVKVLDFGIVKLANSSLTMGSDSGAPGTPAYMSPEQVSKKEIDGRSDLYSLAIVLYSMVTGVVPFRGQGVLQTLYMHVHEPVPDVRAAAMTPISAAFAALITRTLSKDPAHRPQGAREMRAMLQACLEGARTNGVGFKLATDGRRDSSPPVNTLRVVPQGTDPSLSLPGATGSGPEPLEPAFFDGLLSSTSEPPTATGDDTHPSVSGYPRRGEGAVESASAAQPPAAFDPSKSATGAPRRNRAVAFGAVVALLFAVGGGLVLGHLWVDDAPVATVALPVPVVTPAPVITSAPTPVVTPTPAVTPAPVVSAAPAPEILPSPSPTSPPRKRKKSAEEPNEVLDLKI